MKPWVPIVLRSPLIFHGVGVGDNNNLRRRCHCVRAKAGSPSSRPASLTRRSRSSAVRSTMVANSLSLPREISSRRYASSASPRKRWWNSFLTIESSGSGRPSNSASCLPLRSLSVRPEFHEAGAYSLRYQQVREIGERRASKSEAPALLTMESDSVSARARTPRKARTGCHRAKAAPARDAAASGGSPENLRQSS